MKTLNTTPTGSAEASSRGAGFQRGEYVESLRRKHWRENSLASADEDISGNFDWKLIARFGPYLRPYRGATWLSVFLMLAYTGLNLANPYLIGVAVDNFIATHDLRGLA